MLVRFTIDGEPKGKGRPRFSKAGNKVITRTPDDTVFYENLVKMQYKLQCDGKRFADNDELIMQINAYFAIPKSASKKKAAEMLAMLIRPTKKPDFDNIGKIIADSLNGLAYRDDSQIVSAAIHKIYSDRPRVEVTIENKGGYLNER